jgi:hypothetical protein
MPGPQRGQEVGRLVLLTLNLKSLSADHMTKTAEKHQTLSIYKKKEHHRFQTNDIGHIHQEMTTPWTESDHNRIMMSPTTKLHIQLDPSPTRETSSFS